jgi:hypothetical protein
MRSGSTKRGRVISRSSPPRYACHRDVIYLIVMPVSLSRPSRSALLLVLRLLLIRLALLAPGV